MKTDKFRVLEIRKKPTIMTLLHGVMEAWVDCYQAQMKSQSHNRQPCEQLSSVLLKVNQITRKGKENKQKYHSLIAKKIQLYLLVSPA